MSNKVKLFKKGYDPRRAGNGRKKGIDPSTHLKIFANMMINKPTPNPITGKREKKTCAEWIAINHIYECMPKGKDKPCNMAAINSFYDRVYGKVKEEKELTGDVKVNIEFIDSSDKVNDTE